MLNRFNTSSTSGFSPVIRRCTSRSGFSLVELLTVIVIIALTASLVVPAFTSLGKSSALSVSANQVANLVNRARENAMSKNAMTALVVVTETSLENSNRVFILLELSPRSDGSQAQPSDWKQIGKWESLLPGVLVDPSNLSLNKSSAQAGESGVPTPAFPTLAYHGQTVSTYSYVVFLPGGNLLGSTSPQVMLAEGNLASGAVTYTRPAGGGGPANYYKLTILTATGRLKIDRP